MSVFLQFIMRVLLCDISTKNKAFFGYLRFMHTSMSHRGADKGVHRLYLGLECLK